MWNPNLPTLTDDRTAAIALGRSSLLSKPVDQMEDKEVAAVRVALDTLTKVFKERTESLRERLLNIVKNGGTPISDKTVEKEIDGIKVQRTDSTSVNFDFPKLAELLENTKQIPFEQWATSVTMPIDLFQALLNSLQLEPEEAQKEVFSVVNDPEITFQIDTEKVVALYTTGQITPEELAAVRTEEALAPKLVVRGKELSKIIQGALSHG